LNIKNIWKNKNKKKSHILDFSQCYDVVEAKLLDSDTLIYFDANVENYPQNENYKDCIAKISTTPTNVQEAGYIKKFSTYDLKKAFQEGFSSMTSNFDEAWNEFVLSQCKDIINKKGDNS
jgi:hypothetical protein